MISFHDKPSLDAFARSLRLDPQVIRRMRTAFFKKSRGVAAALDQLPTDARSRFAAEVEFRSLSDVLRFDSAIDGASKLVSKTATGFSIETVILRPATGRTALCVSSQVGCAAACVFCATGHMGIARDLSPSEILDQITLANELVRDEGRRVRNLVFMGMGEPMHNEAAVGEVLERLQDPAVFAHPASRVLVSTVGVPTTLLRFAKRFPSVNFALSLHSAIQGTREQIIPLAKRYSVERLRETAIELNRIQPDNKFMIEYLMLDGLNDDETHASALIDWLAGIRAHVNLIPFNPIEQAPHLKSTPRPRIEDFSARLRAAGYPTTIRYSLGGDIDAACGQLVQDENRAVAAELSKRSAAAS